MLYDKKCLKANSKFVFVDQTLYIYKTLKKVDNLERVNTQSNFSNKF